MDTKKFVEKIKELIKIETKNAIKSELNSLIIENQKLKKRVVLLEQKILKQSNNSTFKNIMTDNTRATTKIQQKTKPIVLSKDPTLNSILKETMEEQYRTMNFDSSNVQGWHSQMQNAYENINMESNTNQNIDDVIFQTVDTPDFNQTMQNRMASKGINMPSVNNVNTMIPDDLKGRLDGEALPDFLQGALTRNYSQLVKAQSKKK